MKSESKYNTASSMRTALEERLNRMAKDTEKLHAYTLPRQTPNSRVKDLVDLLILARMKTMDIIRLKTNASMTFNRRKTHEFPPIFQDPPDNWVKPFEKFALECHLVVDLRQAVDEVRGFCNKYNLIL